MRPYVIALAILGVLVAAYIIALFSGYLDAISSSRKILLPNSALFEAVKNSAIGHAFLARYPDSQSFIFQDFNVPDSCCNVQLVHYHNPSSAQGDQIGLYSALSVSHDLKNITVASTQVTCSSPRQGGNWIIRGDVIKALFEKRECWDVGPPPKPSESQLVEMARNTTVAKAYFARYPDNTVTVKLNDTPSRTPEVTFTPTLAEPIQYGVSFLGLNWDVSQVWVVCANGDYRYASDSDFQTYIQPDNPCLKSVHDNLISANQTQEAKAFLAKYPGAKITSGDSSGESPRFDSNSTIQFSSGRSDEGNAMKEARLIVFFRPGNSNVTSFEVLCSNYNIPTAKTELHAHSGASLDVGSILQDGFCPIPCNVLCS